MSLNITVVVAESHVRVDALCGADHAHMTSTGVQILHRLITRMICQSS